MRIACTSCNAVYELPAERVRPGRGVRCARCGTVWVPVETQDVEPEIRPVPVAAPAPAAEPEPEPAAQPLPEPPQPPLQPLPPQPPPGPERVPVVAEAPVAVASAPEPAVPGLFPVLLAWLLSLLAVAGLLWALVHWRGAVTAAWPPSERAYRLLKLDLPGH